MTFRLNARAGWFALAAGGLAAAAVTWLVATAPSGAVGSADLQLPSLVRLSSAPLGVNLAAWDAVYASQRSVAIIQPLLTAAGIRQLHYGGSYADSYDWQTNTSIRDCLPAHPSASFTASCAIKDALDFGRLSREGREIGAQIFATVNYGSGTPAEAAAWVRQANRTPGEAVALWEVGNEPYGCWEIDKELAGPPARYSGYIPGVTGTANASCPRATQGDAAGSRTLGVSYAVNAQGFMRAMKAADPAARLGVPWAFEDPALGGAVPYGSEWDQTVLRADKRYISFVDLHYYPFHFSGSIGGANPSARQVLQALHQIPSLYQATRAELNAYDPQAAVVVGETGVSSDPTTYVCDPAGALFAGGDVLSWLAAGAESVDWWNMNNYGNTGSQCSQPDFGLLTSSSPPVPETPYYGYLLASLLAQPHAQLGTLDTSDSPDVLAFQSALPDGKSALAFINVNVDSAKTVTFRPAVSLTGELRTWTYRADRQNSANSEILASRLSASSVAKGITIPPETMMVLETA